MDNQNTTHQLFDLLDHLLHAGWYCVFIPFEQGWGCALARGQATIGVARADTVAEALLLAFRRACLNAEHTSESMTH